MNNHTKIQLFNIAIIEFLLLVSLFGQSSPVFAEFQKTKIAVLDFRLQGEGFDSKDMGGIVAEWLITALVKDGRFGVIERKLLGQVMEEQKMIEYGIVNESTVNLGALLGVKVIITGSVLKLKGTTEVNARIIDIESASIIAAENVKSKHTTELHDLVNEMAAIIIKNFPLEGYIAHREDDKVIIDLGLITGVKPGMKFRVYEEGNVIKHPKTGEVLDVQHINIGEVDIITVRKKISEGIIIQENSPNAIKYGHLVKSFYELTTATTTPPPRTTTITPTPVLRHQSALTVKSTPSSARIRILNIKPEYYPGIVLSPGQYHIEVSNPSFVTQKTWITLDKYDHKIVEIVLSQYSSTSTPTTNRINSDPNTRHLSPVERTYIKKLRSSNLRDKIYAAKKITRNHKNNMTLLKAVYDELEAGYKTNRSSKHYISAMAWLGHALAASGNSAYLEILKRVATDAPQAKLRKYARNDYKRLAKLTGKSRSFWSW